jgi:tRNA (cytidine32/uridine32-2'-O)-methyltransferase
MFDQIKIILSHTTHPGNIGAVARALKNMGFKHLCLVSPKIFPSEEANARAAGAEDILALAEVVATVDEALADCHWVFGLSARARKIALPILTVRRASEKIANRLLETPPTRALKIGLVFGQEQSGLLNEELAKCHYQISIPANPDYSSLNLAQAVQIVSYELRMAILSINLSSKSSIVSENADKFVDNEVREIENTGGYLATMGEVERYYKHLEETLVQIHFLDLKSPGYLMRHLRRLYAKSCLTKIELNILHGILTAIEKGVSF